LISLVTFFFPLLQDSQDSDDESKCLCNISFYRDVSYQRPNLQNRGVNFIKFLKKMICLYDVE
jgi:hypothetical protein